MCNWQVGAAVSSHVPILILVSNTTEAIGPAEIAQDTCANRTADSYAGDIGVGKVYGVAKAITGRVSGKRIQVVGKYRYLCVRRQGAKRGKSEQYTEFFHRKQVVE
jgi:hypothetical protein